MNNQIKNVLLVGPIPPPFGGIPAYVQSLLISEMDEFKYSLLNTAFPRWVVPLEQEGQRSYNSIFEGHLWTGIKKIIYTLYNYLSYFFFLIIHPPQIIQVFTCTYWGYWRSSLFILIAKILRKKTIFHILGAIDLFYDEVCNFQKFIIRKSLNLADIYLLQSPGLERWVKQYSNKKVKGIWNGINLKIVPTKNFPPPDWFTADDSLVGITIGNLGINKGTPDIIEALDMLREADIRVRWIFIGRGDVNYYKSKASKYLATNQFLFTDTLDEEHKWRFLHHSDFYCLPSYAEGQPISILEAMACGLPVISTKVGSIPEIIKDDINGFLIEPGNVNELVLAIKKMNQDPGIRKSMGLHNLNLVQKQHTIDNLYKSLHDIYLSMSD